MNDREQKAAAKDFANAWKDKGYEKGESQPFWLALLRNVFGIEKPEEFITFEEQVKLDHTSFNYYLKYTFDSAYFQYKINREATGTAQKGFYLKQLAMSLIPLPTLEEQHRIISKIDELLLY